MKVLIFFSLNRAYIFKFYYFFAEFCVDYDSYQWTFAGKQCYLKIILRNLWTRKMCRSFINNDD